MRLTRRPTLTALQRDWTLSRWMDLSAGDVVAFTFKDTVVIAGTVETHTKDRSTVWILPSDGEERAMCFADDKLKVWTPPSDLPDEDFDSAR